MVAGEYARPHLLGGDRLAFLILFCYLRHRTRNPVSGERGSRTIGIVHPIHRLYGTNHTLPKLAYQNSQNSRTIRLFP